MVKCTNCIHYFVCKTLKRKMEDYFAEACVAYLNRGDLVAVVRCKDCKHWSMGYCNHFAYYSYEPMTSEDDFCSYGERREGE